MMGGIPSETLTGIGMGADGNNGIHIVNRGAVRVGDHAASRATRTTARSRACAERNGALLGASRR